MTCIKWPRTDSNLGRCGKDTVSICDTCSTRWADRPLRPCLFDSRFRIEKKKHFVLNADAFGLSGSSPGRDVSHLKAESKPHHLEFYLEGVLWCMFYLYSPFYKQFVSYFCKALWIVLYMKCAIQINLTWLDLTWLKELYIAGSALRPSHHQRRWGE